MSDLDRRAIDRIHVARPEWRDYPDDEVKRTVLFAWVRLGVAVDDLKRAVLGPVLSLLGRAGR